jgi:H+/Cl- antiporter ClcA
MLAVAAGLSLGKEGPMVHIAICLGKNNIKTATKPSIKFKSIKAVILISVFHYFL